MASRARTEPEERHLPGGIPAARAIDPTVAIGVLPACDISLPARVKLGLSRQREKLPKEVDICAAVARC
ncbi:hypothetical protein AK812_SmicGene8466 [Symbiodinium microadriaticum]|uniref:Uncharacterized protein n=1 Tax=Symbiodinium microadriaticum TaxID=2951 RepID=A0A1Q9EKU2_SYMMI|nr:hypothetical protein AK812_SmicGene8466 [Symbiodinium microadriaticum]